MRFQKVKYFGRVHRVIKWQIWVSDASLNDSLVIFLVSILLLPVWFSTRHLVDFPKLPLNSTFARVEYSVIPRFSVGITVSLEKLQSIPWILVLPLAGNIQKWQRRFQIALSQSMLCNSLLSPSYSSAFVYKLAIILMIADATLLDVADWWVGIIGSWVPAYMAWGQLRAQGYENSRNLHSLLWKERIFPYRWSHFCICSIFVLFGKACGLLCVRHILSPFALIKDIWNTKSNHIAPLLLLT